MSPSPLRRAGDDVWVVGNGLVNAYLVAEGRDLLLVDGGTVGMRGQLRAALDALDRDVGDIVAVVLTRGHSDHYGTVPWLRTATGAPVHLHPEDAALVAGERTARAEAPMAPHLRSPRLAARVARMIVSSRGRRYLPLPGTRPVAAGEVLDVPGHPRVLGLPGHTRGSIGSEFPALGAAARPRRRVEG